MSKVHNKLKFSQDNIHLLDIFYNNSYLELGTINYEIVKKLLRKKALAITKIVDFNIQNIGLGASKITNKFIKTNLPYIYFDNIAFNDYSFQLFITYGLISYKEKGYKELFAPLVLIPINLTIANGNIFIQVIGEPTENNVLINYLINNYNIKPNLTYKLNNIYQLDQFCMQFSKNKNMKVKIENYLTFAKVIYPQIVVDNYKFSLITKYNLENKYLLKDSEIYNITKLNYKQRLAMQRARAGSSFAIIGNLGTGKTNTLINIACDAFYRNNKVLYVSNNKETLKYISKLFYEKQLDSIIIDLTRSFSCFYDDENEDYHVYEDDFKANLLNNYINIDKYEKLLSSRILNFRCLDILKMKFLSDVPKENVVIDDLSWIYKHEYEEIVHSLKAIEAKMKKLGKKFKDSKFTNIPINHQIKYPNQIITLLFQIHKYFSELSANSKLLHSKYGFKEIVNYAKFRNVINNFNNINIEKVPKSWKNVDNFFLASEKYLEFKNLIYTIQEYELYIDWDYQNLDSINVDEEINKILGKYFSVKDLDIINKIFENQHIIISRLQIARRSCLNYLDAEKKIAELFNWSFSSDDKAITEIIKLTNYLNENYVYKRWLNINNYEVNRKKIIYLHDKIERYYALEKLYYKYFKNLDYINANITRLVNYIKAGKVLKKYRGVNLNDLVNCFKELKILKKGLEKAKKDYYLITGREYNKNNNILVYYDNLYKYLVNIYDYDYRTKIINFLAKIDYHKLGYYLRYLNIFKSSYNNINETYQYIMNFLPKQKHENHIQKLKFLLHLDYFSDIKKTTLKMKNVFKNETIRFEDYLKLQERLSQLKKKKEELYNNKIYLKLYGYLFNYEKTNVNEIGRIIKKFSAYIECFDNYESIKMSLNSNVHQEIHSLLNGVNKIIYEISETFKLYGKIFKDGVGNYYYEDFDEVINYLSELMKAKEELIIYLEITEHLKVISKYRLYALNNVIINNKVDNIVNLFQYTYFNTLYQLLIDKYPEILDTIDLNNILLNIRENERKLMDLHINTLQQKKYRKISNTSFDEYIRNAGKFITLTNTFILNQLLDINEFDLILIDDAHLTNANEYYKAITCKQVIVAGEYDDNKPNAANIISRIEASNIMKLNYRYSITPLNLLSSIKNLHGPFYGKVSDNIGYEVKTLDEASFIAQIFIDDPLNHVTYFTPKLVRKWEIYENVAIKLLENNIDEKKVFSILNDQFHIGDLLSGYGYDSDYNVISLEEYENTLWPNFTSNTFTNMILCRKKLFIIDNNQLLNKEKLDFFAMSLNPIFKQSLPFNPYISGVLKKLSFELNKNSIIVHGSYHDLSLVIESNNQYYGILLFVNPDTSHINILEDYREYYQILMNNKVKVIVVWLIDLVNNFDKCINEIKKGIGNESSTWREENI